LFDGLLCILLTAVISYYGLVHWRVIWLIEPATVREPAWVANVKGFLDPRGSRPYTLQSFPGNSNVYGIGYLWGAAPFARFFQFGPWANLRIGNAFYLGLLLLTLGWACRNARWLHLAFGLVLVYALFVSSPSIAAGPDILACFLYVMAWVIVAKLDLSLSALCLSIVLGFLALITKPYLVLVVPAIGTYLFLFRSIRSGFLYTLGTLAFFGAGLWIVHLFYPYYFISVFGVHLAATSRHPMVALNQWGELLALAPVPFLVSIPAFWRGLRSNVSNLRLKFGWATPVFRHGAPVTVYEWGALVAAAALAVSLSWHGGAHMIYFWHLLLPLLVLSQLQGPVVRAGWLCINLLLLLVLRPPLPAVGTSEVWHMLQEVVAKHPRIYLDPLTVSLRPDDLGNANRENALSESIIEALSAQPTTGKGYRDLHYLVDLAQAANSGPLLRRAEQFVKDEQKDFLDQKYDAILLTEGIFYKNHILPAISARYHVTAGYYVYSYYLNFRNRLDFGRYPIRVLLFEPRKPLPAVSRGRNPIGEAQGTQ
jgi:hypothetical protein